MGLWNRPYYWKIHPTNRIFVQVIIKFWWMSSQEIGVCHGRKTEISKKVLDEFSRKLILLSSKSFVSVTNKMSKSSMSRMFLGWFSTSTIVGKIAKLEGLSSSNRLIAVGDFPLQLESSFKVGNIILFIWSKLVKKQSDLICN